MHSAGTRVFRTKAAAGSYNAKAIATRATWDLYVLYFTLIFLIMTYSETFYCCHMFRALAFGYQVGSDLLSVDVECSAAAQLVVTP